MGRWWMFDFKDLVDDASAGRSEFPVTFTLDCLASPAEVCTAFRVARGANQRIAAVEHRVDYSQPSPRSVFTVRLGMLDPNPPPFLEQYPMPLVEA